MKTITLSVIAVLAFILMIAEPASEENFLTALIMSKVGGLVLIYLDIYLYQRWNKQGKMDNLNRWFDE